MCLQAKWSEDQSKILTIFLLLTDNWDWSKLAFKCNMWMFIPDLSSGRGKKPSWNTGSQADRWGGIWEAAKRIPAPPSILRKHLCYIRALPLHFQRFPCVCCFLNSQPKIILVRKGLFWGGKFCSPSKEWVRFWVRMGMLIICTIFPIYKMRGMGCAISITSSIIIINYSN